MLGAGILLLIQNNILDTSDLIQIISIIITTFISITSIVIAILTLKQTNKTMVGKNLRFDI